MNKSLLLLLSFFSIILFAEKSYGQGCSDAGFCTVNSFKPNTAVGSETERNLFKAGTSIGAADHDISVWSNYLEYDRFLSSTVDVGLKITTMSQSGNGISSFGLADIFLNANFKVNDKLKLTLGTKIPLADGNLKENNRALPMDYQPSLGTFDLILGAGYELNKLQLAVALQQPLSQNKNQFYVEAYPPNSALRRFQTTNRYQRKADILIRASYPFDLSPRLKFTPGLLPIYHLANDEFTAAEEFISPTSPYSRQEIVGSKGLTLNGNIYLDYMLNKKSTLELNLGTPFISRDARPDGLTRSFLATLEYRIRF